MFVEKLEVQKESLTTKFLNDFSNNMQYLNDHTRLLKSREIPRKEALVKVSEQFKEIELSPLRD